jgi:uncharacterized protein (TIGR02391 family)
LMGNCEQIKEVRVLIDKFKQEFYDILKEIRQSSEALIEACGTIKRSWSGSFAGWHGNMYYLDFQIPSLHEKFNGEWGGVHGIPDGWDEKQPEKVCGKLEELVGGEFTIKEFESSAKRLQKAAEDFRREIVIILSVFDFNSSMVKEKELFIKLENLVLGNTKNHFISLRLPRTMMSRDSEAVRQGMCTPAWLYYEGVGLEGGSICEAIDELLVLTDRLARQIDNTIKADKKPNVTDRSPLGGMHPHIYSKCHELYEKRMHAEAVEKGFKVVRDRLRKLTGYETGSEAFGKGKLHIKGAAAANVDTDFNNAVKFLAMAIDQFRNEKSHTSDARIDDPIRAYEYLRLSSLAMHLLEDAEILT